MRHQPHCLDLTDDCVFCVCVFVCVCPPLAVCRFSPLLSHLSSNTIAVRRNESLRRQQLGVGVRRHSPVNSSGVLSTPSSVVGRAPTRRVRAGTTATTTCPYWNARFRRVCCVNTNTADACRHPLTLPRSPPLTHRRTRAHALLRAGEVRVLIFVLIASFRCPFPSACMLTVCVSLRLSPCPVCVTRV